MTPRIDEVAPDLYRISLYVKDFDLQFNHFLIRDDEPLLFHTGMRGMFPLVREAVGKVIDPAQLRWIGWSHFEVDECGALNEWLAAAPQATPVCSPLAAMINIADFADRPPKGLAEGEILATGRHRFRFVPTPHLPHGWDAGVLFDETDRVLLLAIEKLRGGAVRDMSMIGSFILGASRMLAVNLKRRDRRREALLEACPPEPPAVSVAPAALDERELQGCLSTLAQRERTILLLTFYGDRSSREIAKTLEISEGNVRVIRARAIDRLRACMGAGERAS